MSGDFGPQLFRTGDFGRQSVISVDDFGRCTVKSDGDFWRCAVNTDAAVNSDGDFDDVRWIRTPNSVVFYINILVLISLFSDGNFGRWFRTVILDGVMFKTLLSDYFCTNIGNLGRWFRTVLYGSLIWQIQYIEVSFSIYKYRCYMHKLLYNILYFVISINTSFYIYIIIK